MVLPSQEPQRMAEINGSCARVGNERGSVTHGPGSKVYKAALKLSWFFRTYSARIYFIETNSSLACLHMPHPSNPLDDNRALSFDREHGLRVYVGFRGRLVLSFA
jgi:hypothetical protein